MPAPERDLRLDFFRGLALWFIFIDHIPGNAVSRLTLRNYGFSDAAEVFFFLSGYSAALAYGRVLKTHGLALAAARVLGRCWQLYKTHIVLFVIFSAQIAYVAAGFNNPIYADEMNILSLYQEPHVTFIQALLLRFRPVNMDVLPAYIVILLGFPAALWGLARSPLLVALASLALYVATRAFGWNLPMWPQAQGWVFNPFAWQFLFVMGAVLGTRHGQPPGESWTTWRRPILAAAGAYLVFALFVVGTWYFPRLEALLPDRLQVWMYPIDKPNLDALRILHFFALLAVVSAAVRPNAAFLSFRASRPVVLCGQHSLEVFCLGIVLAFMAHFVLREVAGGLGMQVLVSLGGVALMTGLAGYLSWLRRAGKGGGG